MKTRTPLIRAAVATAIVASIFAITHRSLAVPVLPLWMPVDAGPLLAATLLPVVSVYADATDPDGLVAMRLAATETLPVTLLPTVHVTARMPSLWAQAPRMPRTIAKADGVRAES